MDEILTLTHATERDIDLLLVEELRCSAIFIHWFVDEIVAATGSKISFETSKVIHSKRRTYNRREIDICLALNTGHEASVCILIENKLDTSEQFEQAESYRAEAEFLKSSGVAQRAYTVLVCPDAYGRQNSLFGSKFDAIVSYERIAAHFAKRGEESGEIGLRLKHRHEMLEQAITKARRGYEVVPLPAVDRFNSKYIALVAQLFVLLKPGPSMLKEGRPGESKTMIFAPDVLPDWPFLPQMRLVHQLREGNANANFYTWGDHFTALAATIGRDLAGTPYRPVPTINKRANGRSGLMIVVDTPSIDNVSGFDAQIEAIASGMRATDELRAWIWSHEEVIKGWSAIVAGRQNTQK